jgi:hypothetical protein
MDDMRGQTKWGYNVVAHGNRWGYLRLGIQGSLQRGAYSGSLEMNPAPIQIVRRHRFEDMFLKSSHHWVISIREADEIGIPRSDFINPQVNLAFWDQINGPGIATPEDVESVYQFSLEWMKQVLEDPTKSKSGRALFCWSVSQLGYGAYPAPSLLQWLSLSRGKTL